MDLCLIYFGEGTVSIVEFILDKNNYFFEMWAYETLNYLVIKICSRYWI